MQDATNNLTRFLEGKFFLFFSSTPFLVNFNTFLTTCSFASNPGSEDMAAHTSFLYRENPERNQSRKKQFFLKEMIWIYIKIHITVKVNFYKMILIPSHIMMFIWISIHNYKDLDNENSHNGYGNFNDII